MRCSVLFLGLGFWTGAIGADQCNFLGRILSPATIPDGFLVLGSNLTGFVRCELGKSHQD